MKPNLKCAGAPWLLYYEDLKFIEDARLRRGSHELLIQEACG